MNRATASPATQYRVQCSACFRPVEACHCESLPTIDNQTDVLILQHRRERTHPFNTARMVEQALTKSRRICDRNKELAGMALPITAHAGLLYPHKNARLLAELPPHERPKQLVILDGTWHHARTMYRDIEQLHALPCFKLAPQSPGRFRIRLEPTDTSLSTVEATVAALRSLEPTTTGFEQLLDAFERMNEQQLAHPLARDSGSYQATIDPTQRDNLNVPRRLLGDLSNVVVAYGETLPGGEQLVYWVAQRLGTNGDSAAVFSEKIHTAGPLDRQTLDHLQLSESDFADAVSPEEFRQRWSRFVRPTDLLVSQQRRSISLLETIGAIVPSHELLKSINYDPSKQFDTLGRFIQAQGLTLAPNVAIGRAGKRLANAITLVNHLRKLAVKD